ncbi:protein-arginine deiminase type-3-like [Eublepharis macularius]|uniref:Protein-arginine deiminase n=1 Tax=Eublepharis macularius TaxID=481883 RepID=A0AA97KKM1_EUBMA|nr:protein-arginine deiminase type-3-like [Eublepharis macularius]
MAQQQRWARLSAERPTSAVYVLGTELALDVSGSAPVGATAFDVWGTAGVHLYIVHDGEAVKIPSCVPRWPLGNNTEAIITMDTPSIIVNNDKVRISYYKDNGKAPMAQALLHLTCVEISLDADTSRSGTVNRKAKNKKTWTWGPEGRGAILLVNCDRDYVGAKQMDNQDTKVQSYADLKDMSLLILTTFGPEDIFDNYQLLLHVSESDHDKVGVFHAKGGKKMNQYKHVLGSGKVSYAVQRDGFQEHHFYVEGLAFPDVSFSGLVTFHTTLLEPPCKDLPEVPIFNDSVVFRMAPWIMTPCTLQPITVYICSDRSNADFVAAVSKLVMKAGCKLIICPELENRGDRWIQDEMEIGYVQAPHKGFPVVFDSPRNGQLKNFPFKDVLGPDFGYVKREPASAKTVSSLDSFGNLEVSPPVTARGKQFPLGRILIGSSFPSFSGKNMARVVQDFLFAQKVQPPVELYSDWLVVGHVDEFLTFVPARDRKGFRLLLASPSACYKLLKEKEQEGHGDALMFEGVKKNKEISIKRILSDQTLRNCNEYFQKCIDWNRDILKEELGLAEEDIIDIPQLFRRVGAAGKAVAYFPDLVNMLVLGKYLGIPKPFGPIINELCCLEEEVRRLLEPLGLSCTFIDDFEPYHEKLGEIHCGTNVRRKPFSFKWWNVIP